MSGKSKERPNIVLINCDDLGYGDIGCYGSPLNRTPALDRLASEGVRFTDFYMAAPVCSPSRGAMMTGCYPTRIGFGWFKYRWVLLPGHEVGLNPEEITFPKLLQEAGYATKLVGKWHCGDQKPFLPTKHGFDSYYGLPYSNDMGMQGNKPTYPPLPLMRDEEVVQEQPDQAALTERYVEDCIRFIRTNRDNPFFLYFAHMYVHTPLFVPPRFLNEARNGPYGAAVECIDWAADAILYELERCGLTDNTLVIFTSDNGSTARNGGSNAPLRGKKGTTWEGGQRVPCIMRWPGEIPPGTVCREVATAMDFYPTLVDLADGDMPKDRIIDGKDIRSLMCEPGAADSPHETFFYYLKNNLEAVRWGKWKLHVHKGDIAIRELYDLEADIGETTNLCEQHPDIVRKLEQRLHECREDIGDDVTGVTGRNVRPHGEVGTPDTVTHYDPAHPYMIAMYD